ncbi:hypothetical protein MT325_m540L [Paramecium bursaria chlorella virus MT325]|uniref:Uncharacterized protein m540L n=1 Tax=Paramecium bursaria Chlorella virus MT325 TaxID=346932 RepID=A7IUS0_PBCVM|nr:hypothetical protein MT325_m540L [Paramecium bursaria chlorella virus MT325]
MVWYRGTVREYVGVHCPDRAVVHYGPQAPCVKRSPQVHCVLYHNYCCGSARGTACRRHDHPDILRQEDAAGQSLCPSPLCMRNPRKHFDAPE